MTQVHDSAMYKTRQARIRLVSEGVVAAYIHDISARPAHDRRGLRNGADGRHGARRRAGAAPAGGAEAPGSGAPRVRRTARPHRPTTTPPAFCT
jgi:hypothetical protein